MGRWGFGILDSEMAWDLVGDLSEIAGLDLNMIGRSDLDWDSELPPIMSEDEARDHLNSGNFTKVFERLQYSGRNDYLLCIFVAVCMTVGVKINMEQINYMKAMYWKTETGLFCGGVRQLRLALQEYKSGEPYRLEDFGDDCCEDQRRYRDYNHLKGPYRCTRS